MRRRENVAAGDRRRGAEEGAAANVIEGGDAADTREERRGGVRVDAQIRRIRIALQIRVSSHDCDGGRRAKHSEADGGEQRAGMVEAKWQVFHSRVDTSRRNHPAPPTPPVCCIRQSPLHIQVISQETLTWGL